MTIEEYYRKTVKKRTPSALQPSTHPSALTEDDIKLILKSWDEKAWSIGKIAKETNHSKSAVRKYLRLHGRIE